MVQSEHRDIGRLLAAPVQPCNDVFECANTLIPQRGVTAQCGSRHRHPGPLRDRTLASLMFRWLTAAFDHLPELQLPPIVV